MTNAETNTAATLAEQGAHVALEKASPKKQASQRKGAPKGQKAAKGGKAKAFLRQHGLDVDKQTKPKYVGSQESALMNLYFGLSAAACVSDSTWNTFKKARPEIARSLHVRWETEPLVGLGILARDDAPYEPVWEVAKVLIELNASAGGREVLKAIGVSSFKPADAGTHDGVWEFLNGYRKRFGRTPALGDAE